MPPPARIEKPGMTTLYRSVACVRIRRWLSVSAPSARIGPASAEKAITAASPQRLLSDKCMFPLFVWTKGIGPVLIKSARHWLGRFPSTTRAEPFESYVPGIVASPKVLRADRVAKPTHPSRAECRCGPSGPACRALLGFVDVDWRHRAR